MSKLTIVSKSLNSAVNKKNHHTENITDVLCFRRAQPFAINVTYNRLPGPTDSLKFSAVLKDHQKAKTLMSIEIPISDSTSKTAWSARQVSTDGKSTVNYEINPPANAVIGNYSLIATTAEENYNIGDCVILFNVWSPDDPVYVADSSWRHAYHDVTYTNIYRGSSDRVSYLTWDLGQWEPGMVNICLKLLENTKNPSQRSNPTIVCRDLSAVVNVQDEKGALVGNWSGKYDDGTAPGTWNGSGRILQQYAQTKQPVKYGQCWVFAGVLCTALRTLGMASRVITNFNSAHDTDKNVTIEEYYDHMGNRIDKTDDSVWNFHCWTEVWLSRASDVGSEYSGWQVVDATPQEQSNGRFCLGPAPVFAVKEGIVNVLHDVMFVYTETNGDIIIMYKNEAGETYRTEKDTTSVGRLTCTMSRDLKSLENITLQYKYPEGSKEERHANERAISIAKKFGGFRAMSAEAASATVVPAESLITGVIEVPGSPYVGQDISAVVKLTNKTDTRKDMSLIINAKSVVYNGMSSNPINIEEQQIAMDPNTEKIIPIKIPYVKYEKSLMDGNIIRITTVCDAQGKLAALIEKNITLANPSIEVKAPEEATVGKRMKCEISFLNPLAEPVKDNSVTVEGSGLTENTLVKKIPLIAAQQKGVAEFEFTPTKTGEHVLCVNWNNSAFKDMKGSKTIKVA